MESSYEPIEDQYKPTKSLANLHIETVDLTTEQPDQFSLDSLRRSWETRGDTEALERTENLVRTADTIMDELRDRIGEQYSGSPKKDIFLQAISNNDEETLGHLGFNAQYAAVDHVLAAMVRGRPPIDIETVGPYAAAHETEAGKLEIKMENLPPDEITGILLSVALRRFAASASESVRIVSLLDELNNYRSHRTFTAEEQSTYVETMTNFYRDAGLITERDTIGKDVLLLRESSQVDRIPKMLERLKQSCTEKNIGEVHETPDGNVLFMPTKQFVESLGLKSKNRRDEFRKKGIMLVEKGRPLCQALDAASFLNEENKHLMHVVMLDKEKESQQDKVYALLRAVDIVTSPEQYHNIFADMKSESALPPEFVVLATIAHFRHKANELLAFGKSHTAQDDALPEAA